MSKKAQAAILAITLGLVGCESLHDRWYPIEKKEPAAKEAPAAQAVVAPAKDVKVVKQQQVK